MRASVDARSLDQRVRFESKSSERTSSGAMVTGWTDVCTTWARMDAAKANERIAAGQMHQVDAYTCWVRADVVSRFGLNATMRAVWRGAYYEVKEVPDNGPRGGLCGIVLQGGLVEDGE